MGFDPDGEGVRLLNEWMFASQELSAFLGRGKNLSAGEVSVPRAIDQAYLDQFDALVKVRDATETAYRAWVAGRMSGG